MSAWEKVRREAAMDSHVRDIVLATLEEAKTRIQQADPAPSSKMTFRGGKVRSVGLIRNMGTEISKTWGR